MCKKKVVAIDAGKFNLKGKSEIGEVLFNTKFSLGHTDESMLGNGTYNVTIEDKELTIGNNASFGDKKEGKASDVHVWSTLTAIALLRGDAKQIILMYGESYNKYVQNEHKKLIKDRFEGKHKIEVNGEVHEFEITLCHILPEGLGHILCNLSAYMGVQYVIDWGGATVIFMEVLNGVPQPDKCHSFLIGVNNVNAIISSKLSKSGIGNYTENQVKEWVEKGCSNKKIQQVIDNVITEQLYTLDDKLNGFGIDLHELLKTTFIGGTSQLLSSQIKKHYECAEIYPKGLTANVDGFWEYGRLKFGN